MAEAVMPSNSGSGIGYPSRPGSRASEKKKPAQYIPVPCTGAPRTAASHYAKRHLQMSAGDAGDAEKAAATGGVCARRSWGAQQSYVPPAQLLEDRLRQAHGFPRDFPRRRGNASRGRTLQPCATVAST